MPRDAEREALRIAGEPFLTGDNTVEGYLGHRLSMAALYYPPVEALRGVAAATALVIGIIDADMRQGNPMMQSVMGDPDAQAVVDLLRKSADLLDAVVKSARQ